MAEIFYKLFFVTFFTLFFVYPFGFARHDVYGVIDWQ